MSSDWGFNLDTSNNALSFDGSAHIADQTVGYATPYAKDIKAGSKLKQL